MGRLGAALAVSALLFAAAPARADSDFWREVTEPHADEVRVLLDRAQRLVSDASGTAYGDQDPTGEVRRRRLDDAFGLLRYARGLSPRHPEVLLALGRAAEESGRTTAAIDAFVAYLAGSGDSAPDAHLRLGTLYLRQGRRDDAVHHLREAQASRHPGIAGLAVVHLAAVLEDAGRTTEAIATLETGMIPSAGYWNSDAALVAFALAVAYDRDEQLSAAWTVLDRLQASLAGSFEGQIQAAMSGLRLAPAVDAHYWQALFFESLGDLGEARVEWMHYATGGEAARFRERALAHVAAIDRVLADGLAARRRALDARRPR